MSPDREISPKDLLLALGIIALWGFHFVVIRIGALEIPPLMLLSIRLFLAALIFAPFIKAISWPQYKNLFLYTVPYLVIHLATLFVGLRYLEAGIASLIIQMEMPFLVLLGFLFYKERFGLKSALGMVLALVGVVIIVYQPVGGDVSYIGAALIIISAFFWSVGSLRMRAVEGLDFFSMTFYSHATAFPFILALTLFIDSDHIEALTQANHMNLAFVLTYQVFLMSACLYYWRHLMSRNPAYIMSSFTLLVPVFAVLFSILLMGEVMSLKDVIGGLIVLTGVGIVVMRKRKRRAPVA